MYAVLCKHIHKHCVYISLNSLFICNFYNLSLYITLDSICITFLETCFCIFSKGYFDHCWILILFISFYFIYHFIFVSDVGFDGIPGNGLVNNVLNRYFTKYFPQAVNLTDQLRTMGYEESFIYTTHPWLVSLYTDCPPNLVLSGIKLKVSCPLLNPYAAGLLVANLANIKYCKIYWYI